MHHDVFRLHAEVRVRAVIACVSAFIVVVLDRFVSLQVRLHTVTSTAHFPNATSDEETRSSLTALYRQERRHPYFHLRLLCLVNALLVSVFS